MFKIIFGTLPAWVCLAWAITHVPRYSAADLARKKLTWFLGAATLLYFSHAYYFNLGSNRWVEGVWLFASLASYPLYYLYIRQLTTETAISRRWLMVLLPGVAVALLAWSEFIAEAQACHKICFGLSVLLVVVFGYLRLHAYDQRLAQAFANTDTYSMQRIRVILICFVAASICSSVINVIGKQYFYDSEWLLAIPSVIFAVLLHVLFRTGYRLPYVAVMLSEQLANDAPKASTTDTEAQNESLSPAMAEKIGTQLHVLMTQRQLYLQPNVKLSDLAREIGTCRTYLSTYLNQTLGTDFSTYINQQRIEHAKQQLPLLATSQSIDSFYREFGFASPRAFFRNFKQYTGMTPDEWIKQNHKN